MSETAPCEYCEDDVDETLLLEGVIDGLRYDALCPCCIKLSDTPDAQ
jgi:hypothetical protein